MNRWMGWMMMGFKLKRRKVRSGTARGKKRGEVFRNGRKGCKGCLLYVCKMERRWRPVVSGPSVSFVSLFFFLFVQKMLAVIYLVGCWVCVGLGWGALDRRHGVKQRDLAGAWSVGG